MRTVMKGRWVILVLWIAAAWLLVMNAPGMESLVREKGQINVPDGYPSVEASEWMAEIGQDSDVKELSTVLVFHREDGLSAEDVAETERAVRLLQNADASYGISSVTSHFDTEELKDQMLSEDGSTIIALVMLDENAGEAKMLRSGLDELLQDVSVEHYYTGSWIISEDIIQSSTDGLRKTEVITVVFILIILIIVFRSVVTPFVPLLTVGFSYLVSQSIVAYLVEYLDFPLSNFTQIFLVAVLFGIGTDYCILLLSRYKEELINRHDKKEAIQATYRTAGKTVLFSGIAVLVGFASIGLSEFVLYRSAVAVAIGVIVLLVALYTLVPFFMYTFGNALFWPSKRSSEHKDSRIWDLAGAFSLKRPLWSLLVVAVIIIPFLISYKGAVSYNSLDEIGEKYDSVKAFNLIADGFSAGESLPTTVVLKGEVPFDTSEGLGMLEKISREVGKVEGVDSVRSATRPTGELLEDFLVSGQVTVLEDGLGQSGDGLSEISGGLAEASRALSANGPQLEEAVAGAGKLAAGTNELKAGVSQLANGLKQLERGLLDGSAGASELTAGLQQAQASAAELAAASKELLAGYEQLGSGVSGLSAGYSSVTAEQLKLAEGLGSLQQGLGAIQQSYPELQNDASYQTALATLAQLQQGAAGIGDGLAKLNVQLEALGAGIAKANAGMAQAAGGQAALAEGLGQLASGLAELQQGIAQAAAGQGRLAAELPAFEGGLTELAAGQQELQSGFAALSEQLGELTSGLDQSVDGLNQVTEGLSSASGYLSELSGSPDKELSGWYIPEEAIQNEQLQTVLDVYMSEDRKTVKLDVIFATNPYTQDAMSRIGELEEAVYRVVEGTSFSDVQAAVGGVTSINHDLNTISDEDYSRTVVLILVSLLIILVILFRSVVMPIYMVASLLVTYYTSMAITELIFVNLLGYDGITWAVPFFGFVMLMALGIDYSIFLMDRFKEYSHLSPEEGIHEAMKKMGTVIMSAALILGGTFAAMLPSGVLSLLQIATVVLCGLFLYALIMLPLFIPVMVKLFGPANWWPFKAGSRSKRESGNDTFISH